METRSSKEIEGSTERLIKDLKTVVNSGEELLQSTVEDLSEGGQVMRERLAAALEVAKETSRKLQAQAIDSAKAADRMVREYPYQAVGIAFGVGLVVGVLVNRNRK
jgi:ElaB/YqjD/DUF883 family membrane-anchored ribosome-binding protein